MSDVFVFGTLRDDALRRVVTDCDTAHMPAALADHRVMRAARGDHPVLAAGAGVDAVGLVLSDLTDTARARLDFYESGFGYHALPVEVRTDAGVRPALVYRPGESELPGDAAWNLADWQAGWGGMTRAAAHEVMSLIGRVSDEELRFRMTMIRVRAGSALRAVADKPVLSWHRAGMERGDVTVIEARQPYAHFFAVAEHDLTHRRFDGRQSARMNRAGFAMGDAVTVLPYDPVRDRVLLVEQFRFGIFLRGDPVPWSLEPVAGRIDPGETPEDAARRETVEEAGLDLQRLLKIGAHYPSPAGVSEFLYSYVGLCDLPDMADGTGGLAEEHEDIRTHVMGFDALLALADRGEIENSPLLLSVFWLLRERGRPGAFA